LGEHGLQLLSLINSSRLFNYLDKKKKKLMTHNKDADAYHNMINWQSAFLLMITKMKERKKE
jgi:hypothetical protein